VWIQYIRRDKFADDYDTTKGLDEISLAKLLNVDREALNLVADRLPGGGVNEPGGIRDQVMRRFGFDPLNQPGNSSYINYTDRRTKSEDIGAWQHSVTEHFLQVLRMLGMSPRSGVVYGGELVLNDIYAATQKIKDEDGGLGLIVSEPPLDGGDPDVVAPQLNAIIHKLAKEEDWGSKGLPNMGGSRKTRKKRHRRHRKTSSRRPKSKRKLKKTKSKPKKRVKKSRKQYRSK
tara:strand:- start:42 stop:737 length:696 start_codon:yes stop_codon:yes gene_type:complete